jgi:hypothetical protein
MIRFSNYDFNGNVSGDTFALWRNDPRTRMFYGVLYGQVVVENGKAAVHYIIRPNIIGMLAGALLTIGMFMAFLSDQSIEDLTIGMLLLASLFAALFGTVIYLGYRYGNRGLEAEFKKIIRSEVE